MIEYRSALPDEVEDAWRLAATLNASPACAPDRPIGGLLRDPNAEWAVGTLEGQIVAATATVATADGRMILCGVILPEHDSDAEFARLGATCALGFDWLAGEAQITAGLAHPPQRTVMMLAAVYGPTAAFTKTPTNVRFTATVVDGRPQGAW